jgi:hypothetical protein
MQQTKAPTKASLMFAGTQEKCIACNKTVYPIEKVCISFLHSLFPLYHRILFPYKGYTRCFLNHYTAYKTFCSQDMARDPLVDVPAA